MPQKCSLTTKWPKTISRNLAGVMTTVELGLREFVVLGCWTFFVGMLQELRIDRYSHRCKQTRDLGWEVEGLH